MSQYPSEYREVFLIEARTSLDKMNVALVEFERSPRDGGQLDEIFRETHTLKGMAASMRLERLAKLCHALEDKLEAIRRGKSANGDLEILFEAFDAAAAALVEFELGRPEPDTSRLVSELHRPDAAASAPEEALPPAGAPVVVARSGALPVKVERLDLLMNLAEQLVVAKMRVNQLKAALPDAELSSVADVLERIVSELHYQLTQARMVPLSFIVSGFARLTRDLARQQGKQVALKLEGMELGLDRSVADDIRESLLHLVRNALVHGIEPPEERQRAGKPAQGTVRIAANRTKESAMIEVEDDGAGLDFKALGRAAAERGLLPPKAPEEDILKALSSGLSSTKTPDALSGRGLGIDIVGRKMRARGGRLSIDSQPSKGAIFRMEIPLSLAVLKAMFVEVGGRKYAVPLSVIERIVTVSADQIRSSMGLESVVLGGKKVVLLRLRERFGLPPRSPGRFPVVVVRHDNGRLGLVADSLSTTEEIVLKPLNRALRGIPFFSGSAIIGAGEAILVLDIGGLMLQAMTGAGA